MLVKDLKEALFSMPDDMEICIAYRRKGRFFASLEIERKKYFFSSINGWFTSQKSFTENIFVISAHIPLLHCDVMK